jgi:hypothetical protein
LRRERDHDEGVATWRPDADRVGGSFVNGEFQPDPTPVRARLPSDAIIDPQPELARLHAYAFNQSRRASGFSPSPAKPGRFNTHRSLRRV